VEALSEGDDNDRRLLLLGLIEVSVSRRSRLVVSLSGNAFLRRLVAPDLGVEHSSEPCDVMLGFIGWSRGMSGVFTPVDKVGELWKTKNGVGRTLGGKRTGLLAPFVPTDWWRQRFREGERPTVVTNEC
jgi:hypothetical protein